MAASILIFAPVPLAAQTPSVRGLITGDAAIGYSAVTEGDAPSNFTADLAPVGLFQIGDDLLLETEADIELEGTETAFHLSHIQLHYLGFEHLQVTAGRFHLPFGVWMHQNWINRMPTPPLLYEDTHGEPTENALLPVLYDLGVLVKTDIPLFEGWKTAAAVWVSQGPASGIAPHEHGDGEAPAETGGLSDAPLLAYGANFDDNNSNKMVGVQLRAMSSSGLTLQGSGFTAAYDSAGALTVSGGNLSVVWAPTSEGPQPLFDLRGEGVLLSQEYVNDEGDVDTVDYGGYYVQLSRRYGAFEPVVRWSHLPEAIAGEGPLIQKRRQLALGVNYWMMPSVPLKVAYDIEPDGTDEFFVQWAVGF